MLEELEPRCGSRSRHESLNAAGTKCESKNADSKGGDPHYVDDISFDDVMRVELFGDDVTSDFTSNSASHFSSSSLNREKASWMSDSYSASRESLAETDSHNRLNNDGVVISSSYVTTPTPFPSSV